MHAVLLTAAATTEVSRLGANLMSTGGNAKWREQVIEHHRRSRREQIMRARRLAKQF